MFGSRYTIPLFYDNFKQPMRVFDVGLGCGFELMAVGCPPLQVLLQIACCAGDFTRSRTY